MKVEDIVSKDENIDSKIYQILNEAYHEFVECYGDKHSEHIKNSIENITDKIKESKTYYSGPIATANSNLGVIYTKSDELSEVLKHELWHVYNNSSIYEESLQYIAPKYMKQLDENGYIKKIYDDKMKLYKEEWKDEPERLEVLLVDYDKFKNDRFEFEDSPVEMWTEWFNSQTHKKNMKDNYWDWGDGFFTKSNSSGSYYDSYINVADMISCLIPKDKLLEMYLQTDEYKTDYSYPEMIEEFDTTYKNALNEQEKNELQYPYLKIILNVKTVSENARKNPPVALEALQECMKTCFNAYSIKLDNLKEVDLNSVEQIYGEIKYMQEQMVWNVDKTKMQEHEYVKSMEEIQEKFKGIVENLDEKTLKTQEMIDTVDYKENNQYKSIENGEKIFGNIINSQNEKKENLIEFNDYKANVGKSGIKGNLYNSLSAVLEKEKLNLLYDNKDNLLSEFYNKIESVSNESDAIPVFNDIYDFYIEKLENNLKTDENIELLFDRYSKRIEDLQKNALFDTEHKTYMPKLEKVIDVYTQKANEYMQKINECTEKEKQTLLAEGKTIEEATIQSKWISNFYLKDFNKQRSRMEVQRENQYREFENKKQPISIIKEDIVNSKITETEIKSEYEKIAKIKQIRQIQAKKEEDLTNEEKAVLQNYKNQEEKTPKTIDI